MVSLENKFLVTMPHLDEDPVFGRSMIYICEHDKNGAMGVIINKPIPEDESSDIISSVGLDKLKPIPKVFFGGPVGMERGFILHNMSYENSNTIKISSSVGFTYGNNIFKDIKNGKGPKDYRLILGYAGWEAGQIEKELEHGDWMLIPSSKNIFDIPDIEKWSKATTYLGINVRDLSGQSGLA